MRILSLIIVLAISISSCTQRPLKSNTTLPEKLICSCYDGIGSTKGDLPVLKSDFSNGQSLVTCGFLDDEIQASGLLMSEFNVFDCASGKALVEYGAVQICRIEESSDRIVIKELKYLPVGRDWKWELHQIGEQTISIENNTVHVSVQSPKLQKIEIDPRQQELFLSTVEKGSGLNEDWEIELGKLEVLALIGNVRAWEILKDYDSYKGIQVDGALAEIWKDAVANVEWIK